MRARASRQPKIHVAIADDDPLRVIGFRVLLETELDLELEPINLTKLGTAPQADVVLLRDRAGRSLPDEVDKLKAALPGARVLATGTSLDENAVAQSLAVGAKGYISETASSADFAKAIRIVNQGMIWAPRRVLATLVVRAANYFRESRLAQATLTDREKEVLKMLVAGRSNKEIAAPLGIEERTVKAHVAHLMRKLGAKNRIMLSVHAVTHSIVPV
jgi:DNA-binding NarL/FixJ family response regulator